MKKPPELINIKGKFCLLCPNCKEKSVEFTFRSEQSNWGFILGFHSIGVSIGVLYTKIILESLKYLNKAHKKGL